MNLLLEAGGPAPGDPSSGSPVLWAIFGVGIALVLALDLGVFHRKARAVSVREAMAWLAVWVTLAMAFNVGLFRWRGSQVGVEFFTGYVVELSLSVDNIFVFVILFQYFGISTQYQYRVLFWGILGAVILRAVFIFTAVELLERFYVLFYVFGAFLVFTGAKFLAKAEEIRPEKNLLLRLARRLLPVTSQLHGERFLVREAPRRQATADGEPLPPRPGRLVATPLLLTLVAVEATDVVFAVDSVPAILGITSDRFVAYTSNIFAILGLRSMYFVIRSVLDRFHLLKLGLSFVLIFIGAKMILREWIHIEAGWSLFVIASLLGGSVLLSLVVKPRGQVPEPGAAAPEPREAAPRAAARPTVDR